MIRDLSILNWFCLVAILLEACSTFSEAFVHSPEPVTANTSRRTVPLLKSSSLLLSSRNDDNDYGASFSTSTEFSMDPTSPKAKEIMNHLGLSMAQHQKLAALAVLVVDWNTKINLISRRDCSKAVVFGRHIVPSLAPLGMGENDALLLQQNEEGEGSNNKLRVVDVGTGGGFPGLPLAIAYPHIDFLLVDSVGKKLAAVEDMAKALDLTNVKIYHGRAEELALTKEKFDVCVGRSVAAIPKYCFWIQDLLKSDGHLCYLIGGDIEQELLDQTIFDQDIDQLLACPGASDKRVLVFPQPAVQQIANASGEKPRIPIKKNVPFGSNKNKKKKAKGAWEKKNKDDRPKQRGYEGFKRFESNI